MGELGDIIMNYKEFLETKAQLNGNFGFKPNFMPDFLFDFQKYLVGWSIRKGKSAIFADCGLGKTPMQLVWAENVIRKTNGKVLILCPLAVSQQTRGEGEKFNIETHISKDGKPKNNITLTNYEKLHKFDYRDYDGVVCDESSAIKNFEGKRKEIVTQFMRKIPYRLLCTATAAPNDFIELGTSSEALGELGRMDMLAKFFKNDENSLHPIWWGARWRFKRHGEKMFWRWVSSWARALKHPSDYGFPDDGFILPKLVINETIIESKNPFVMGSQPEFFPREANTLKEQRAERRLTLKDRCEQASLKSEQFDSSVLWCYLNDESKYLNEITKDSVQVTGSDHDDKKEESFIAFKAGEIKRLITKPKIGGFGLNWQHCHHMTFFPSHSYEQYYQSVRRMYRFGQKESVKVDIITSESGRGVFKNLERKSKQADEMFRMLVKYMSNSIKIDNNDYFTKKTEVPQWL